MHPILFRLGSQSSGFAIHTYGVMLVIAFLVAIFRTYGAAKKYRAELGNIKPDDILDVGILMIVCGIVGARLLFVVLEWTTYRQNPMSMLKIWEGGLSFHGALFGGLIPLIIYCIRKKYSVLKVADLFAPSVMIAYAIGRVGCFLNGCCYGVPTRMPWGVRFDDDGVWTVPSHPTQLYATAISLVFFGVLVWMERRKAYDGQLLCWYMIFAAIERFTMEIWRAGVTSTVVAFGLTDTQVLCVIMLVGAAIGAVTLRRRSRDISPKQSAVLEASGT
jgi:phosphatidylglycerol:prolipoprotein diacylglycerol transferase